MLIYDLTEISAAVDANGNIRSVITADNCFVTYRVAKHSQPHRIGETKTIKKKSFVDWLEGAKVNKNTFKEGDIILLSGDKFEVLENHGIYGTVRSLTEGFILNNVYWTHGEDFSYKIGHVSQSHISS
jgi:hypothetical protein